MADQKDREARIRAPDKLIVCEKTNPHELGKRVEIPGSKNEFGRDTNRLKFFKVTPLDVRYHSENEAAASYNDDDSQSGQQQQSANSTINLGTNNGNTAQATNNSTGCVTRRASTAVKKFFKESRCWTVGVLKIKELRNKFGLKH
ncbi:hypothetical protein CTI12_AA167960 [Artemisia annua]|uniref:Uncharacterized protein n=1 Tax=Artemisia annua TaxID=35608 RepID=A0A2U1PCU0_ARTAN|nr:hypothetical protein CTI12_AA167960 [Artemisia annua]